ncbi:Aspartic protease [Aphelenchoides fujianensis]|nr:Aspartic protease [Aphelenchoides fujianensis]
MRALALFLVLSIGFFSPCTAEDGGFEIVGRQNRRTAAEIREYHRQQRKVHKNYLVGYPDEAVIFSISIGTPAQNFNVSVETSTAALWVFEPTYTNLDPSIPAYNSTLSSTSSLLNCCWTGKSDNFEYTGLLYEDKTAIHNGNGKPITVTQAFSTVQAIYQTDGDLTNPTFDFSGALGLAWTNVADPQPPILTILNSIPQLPGKMATFWLDKPAGFDSKPSASVAFGRPNSKKCDLDFSAVNMVFWTPPNSEVGVLRLPIDAFTFTAVAQSGQGVATVNYGQPVVLFPRGVIDQLFGELDIGYNEDLGLITTDCANAGVWDDWVFTIGGYDYAIPSTSYISDIGLGDTCALLYDEINGDTQANFAIGSVFFWNFCVKIDVDHQQFGFSKSIPSA